ncbi:MAG: histidine protein kinase SLN1 [Edafosvirus sp.]|uniref:Histidine protein kinase SLN1 n=1 Tax=Edafosvirus sp. TaxID=2487765 RepID=A0A3G4ZV11_9VIRU|nr:MAG: histidine protein kinase SLN1 [Edafosvirus sp.]
MCIDKLFKRKNNIPDKNETISLQKSEGEHNYINTDHDLIVDDSDPNRLVIKKYLTRFGRKSDEACNGQDAIDIITKNSSALKMYDIIWMDIQMPKMNGINCTEHLRTVLKYKGIIIGLTGHVDIDSVNDCKRVGMDDIIAKPIDKKILEMYIEKYKKK